MPAKNNSLVSLIDKKLDVSNFREQHWEGSFWEYLDIVLENPTVARNAFQRVYDMILTYGHESYTHFKQEYIRYKFFGDPIDHGADAIYGLERPLMQLVDFFKSAAQGYGTEKRILLLHGPVGSSKSTIARLLKKGLENYSRTEAGRCYTYMWRVAHRGPGGRRGGAIRRVPDARGAAAADSARSPARRAGGDQRKIAGWTQDSSFRRCLPILPENLRGSAGGLRRRLEESDGARKGQAADPVRKGSPGNRNVPAEG